MEKKYKWCLHCECVYEDLGTEEFLYDGECPYCGASVFLDGWPWSRVREVNPEYPKSPKVGGYYPMYPHERSE